MQVTYLHMMTHYFRTARANDRLAVCVIKTRCTAIHCQVQ